MGRSAVLGIGASEGRAPQPLGHGDRPLAVRRGRARPDAGRRPPGEVACVVPGRVRGRDRSRRRRRHARPDDDRPHADAVRPAPTSRCSPSKTRSTEIRRLEHDPEDRPRDRHRPGHRPRHRRGARRRRPSRHRDRRARPGRRTDGAHDPADLAEPAAIEAIADEVQDADILVNNAAILVEKPIEDMTIVEFDRTIAVNLRAPFLLSRAIGAGMKERGWGRIVNISSVGRADRRGVPGRGLRGDEGRAHRAHEELRAQLRAVRGHRERGRTGCDRDAHGCRTGGGHAGPPRDRSRRRSRCADSRSPPSSPRSSRSSPRTPRAS